MRQPQPSHPNDSPRAIGSDLEKLLAKIESKRVGNRQARQIPETAAAPDPEPGTLAAIVPAAPKQNGRVHPDQRGRLILANALVEARDGKPQDVDSLSYYTPELIQATLPHSDPKTRDWIRRNGDFTLIVSSGVDKNGEVIGVPYGAFPRLLLAHIITQVIATRERRVELASHFTTFLKEIGYTGNHKGNSIAGQRIRRQLIKLLRANITFEYEQGTSIQGHYAAADLKVAPKFELWWDYRSPEQDSLFGSWIELSEDFYRAVLARPVPLKTEVLKALHGSALDLDVYMWVSYRLFGLQAADRENVEVSYAALQTQFGTGIAEGNYRLFRSQLKKSFAKVAAHWHSPYDASKQSLLNYEFSETGVILYRSPLLVKRGARKTRSEEAADVLTARKFDKDTRDQARLRAGTRFTVDYLEEQYFAWLDKRGFTPSNPRSHFLDFVKRHISRNQ